MQDDIKTRVLTDAGASEMLQRALALQDIPAMQDDIKTKELAGAGAAEMLQRALASQDIQAMRSALYAAAEAGVDDQLLAVAWLCIEALSKNIS